MLEIIYFNGKYIYSRNAKVSVNNAGFLYGDGLFETFRSYGGNLYTIDRHLERLFFSLQILKYNTHFSAEDVKTCVRDLLKRNNLLKKDAIIGIYR